VLGFVVDLLSLGFEFVVRGRGGGVCVRACMRAGMRVGRFGSVREIDRDGWRG